MDGRSAARFEGQMTGEHMLPMPTISGYAPGIVSDDPLRIQCGVCGLVETKPDGDKIAIWLILSGSRFCSAVPHVRHCRSCLADHARGCWRRDHE